MHGGEANLALPDLSQVPRLPRWQNGPGMLLAVGLVVCLFGICCSVW